MKQDDSSETLVHIPEHPKLHVHLYRHQTIKSHKMQKAKNQTIRYRRSFKENPVARVHPCLLHAVPIMTTNLQERGRGVSVYRLSISGYKFQILQRTILMSFIKKTPYVNKRTREKKRFFKTFTVLQPIKKLSHFMEHQDSLRLHKHSSLVLIRAR